MKIAEAIPTDEFMLRIIDEDGQVGFFDVKPYLESEAFEPLKDKNQFKDIHNGKYFCGVALRSRFICRYHRSKMGKSRGS